MICAPVLSGLSYIYSSSFPDHVTQSAGDLLFGIQGNFCPNLQSRAKEVGMEYCENVLAQDMGFGNIPTRPRKLPEQERGNWAVLIPPPTAGTPQYSAWRAPTDQGKVGIHRWVVPFIGRYIVSTRIHPHREV